ncbi:hypothetical protein OY671_003267 [Metschnikowia pulcherrima]|nr:hypothetical protein OY671_003267 [Metschnikowia pulcherrima]
MKFQKSIIASALLSFVFAAPSLEGRKTGDIVSGDSENHGSESKIFEIDNFVPNSILRKRGIEADNEAAQAVSDLYNELQKAYFNDPDWKNMEGEFQDFDDKLEKLKETVETTREGAFKEDIAHISQLIAAFKEVTKMGKLFDGCEYPGSELVFDIFKIKAYALALENIQGKSIVPKQKERIEKAETRFQEFQTHKEEIEEMMPGLKKLFVAQTEIVKKIFEVLREDRFSKKEVSSEADANIDDKKTCPEIV